MKTIDMNDFKLHLSNVNAFKAALLRRLLSEFLDKPREIVYPESPRKQSIHDNLIIKENKWAKEMLDEIEDYFRSLPDA